MALLFCFGCSQSKDMYPIDVIKIDPIDVVKIDPIPPPMDMTSTVDSGIKCGARELKTDEGCVPCSVIVPDDYPTINQAIGKGDVVCIRDGVYKEDVKLLGSTTLHGQSLNTIIEGYVLIYPKNEDAFLDTLHIKYLKTGVTNCLDDYCGLINKGPLLFNMRNVKITPLTNTITTSFCINLIGLSDITTTLDNITCYGTNKNNPGIQLNHQSDKAYPVHVVIKNSTIYSFQPINLLISCKNPSPEKINVHIFNNLLLNNLYGMYVGTYTSSPEKVYSNSVRIYNNTVIPVKTEIGLKNSVTFTIDTSGTKFITTYLFNNIYGANLYSKNSPDKFKKNLEMVKEWFVDFDNDNYHLVYDAVPIDQATTEIYPKTDKDGKLRPIDGKLIGTALPDVGAYEYDPKDTK